MTLRFLILFFFSSVFFSGEAQNLSYEIVSNKKVVGSLTVLIVENGTTTNYEVQSDVKLPFNISYSYTLKSTYRDNVLISSSVQSYLNNSLHRSITTTKQGEKYEVNNEGKLQVINETIFYSEALIYVVEPVIQQRLYSDFSGDHKSIKNLGYHKYKMKNLRNGNTSIYKYKNGELTTAVIDYGALTFSIIKK